MSRMTNKYSSCNVMLFTAGKHGKYLQTLLGSTSAQNRLSSNPIRQYHKVSCSSVTFLTKAKKCGSGAREDRVRRMQSRKNHRIDKEILRMSANNTSSPNACAIYIHHAMNSNPLLCDFKQPIIINVC